MSRKNEQTFIFIKDLTSLLVSDLNWEQGKGRHDSIVLMDWERKLTLCADLFSFLKQAKNLNVQFTERKNREPVKIGKMSCHS